MLKTTGFLTRLTLISGLLLLTTGAVYPQTISATLEGRVTDSSGAAVPDAAVTVTNAATGASRSGGSSDQGEYRFALLPAGEYTVTVEKSGFGRQSKRVTLQIGQIASLDFSLAVGAVQEQVHVEASAEVLEPTRTQVSTVINSNQILNLPVNGRQFIDFVLLAPGVSIGATTSGSTDVIVEPVTKISLLPARIFITTSWLSMARITSPPHPEFRKQLRLRRPCRNSASLMRSTAQCSVAPWAASSTSLRRAGLTRHTVRFTASSATTRWMPAASSSPATKRWSSTSSEVRWADPFVGKKVFTF